LVIVLVNGIDISRCLTLNRQRNEKVEQKRLRLLPRRLRNALQVTTKRQLRRREAVEGPRGAPKRRGAALRREQQRRSNMLTKITAVFAGLKGFVLFSKNYKHEIV